MNNKTQLGARCKDYASEDRYVYVEIYGLECQEVSHRQWTIALKNIHTPEIRSLG
jgi:hypothetical protein